METKLKHRILGMIIGSLLTFVTLDMVRQKFPEDLGLTVLIGSLVADVVAIVVGILIVLGLIFMGISYLRKRFKK
jgi:hypothetical protein